SSPKKYRRMSLSIPTTSKPFSEKNAAASEPISPAAPVMTATDMSPAAEKMCRTSGRSAAQQRLDDRTLFNEPAEHVVDDLFDPARRMPSRRRRHSCIVGHVIRDIEGLRVRIAADLETAVRSFAAQARQFCERHTAIPSAADVEHRTGEATHIFELHSNEIA